MIQQQLSADVLLALWSIVARFWPMKLNSCEHARGIGFEGIDFCLGAAYVSVAQEATSIVSIFKLGVYILFVG